MPGLELLQTDPAGAADRLTVFLQGALGGRVRELRVLVRETGVVLRGRVRCFHTKQMAQELVMNQASLPIAANEIEVS